jgi:hypothetical protein
LPVIRRKLDPNEVYSETTRYDQDTDTVQSFVNGEWVDNPAADPRTQTLFPPIATSDPACDGAQRASDAFEGEIDEIITLISETSTFFTIAGAILALFEFGPFGLFIILAIALAHAMLDIGATALTAAFAGDVWDKFKCILFCHMGTDGRIKPGEFGAVQSDVTAKIGGTAGTIINAMLSIAGEAGVNNLAALGTATGDCADCECGDPPCTSLPDWEAVSGAGTIINRTSRYIDVAADHSSGQWQAGIKSPDANSTAAICCCLSSIEVIDGSSGAAVYCYNLCGEPLNDFSWAHCGLLPNGATEIVMVAVASVTGGFTIRFHFQNPCE